MVMARCHYSDKAISNLLTPLFILVGIKHMQTWQHQTDIIISVAQV